MRALVALVVVVMAAHSAAQGGPVAFQPFGAGGTVMEIAYLEDSNFIYIAGLNSSSGAAVTMFDATRYGPLASFDAGIARQLYLFPFLDANTLALVAVRDNGTDFYVLNSVLELMCSNSTEMYLKSNNMGSAGLGIVVGGQLWFLDPSAISSSRNLFWNIDMISCNLSSSALRLASANFSFVAGAQSMLNLGVVLAAGAYNGRYVLASLEFAASNVSIPVAVGAALPAAPLSVTPASPSELLPILAVALTPNTLSKYAGGTGWGVALGSAQLSLPTGHAIARVTYNSALTIVGTRSTTGGGLAIVQSSTLAMQSFAPLPSNLFTAWMSLAASDTSLCAQGVADTVMCWQL